MSTSEAFDARALPSGRDRRARLHVVPAPGESNEAIIAASADRPSARAIDYVGIVPRSCDVGDAGLREQAARVLFNRAVELGALGRGEDAIAVYTNLVERFAAESVPALGPLVATALIFKGVTLGVLGRDDEAIATYDEVIARFEHRSEPAVRAQVDRAQNYRYRKIDGYRR